MIIIYILYCIYNYKSIFLLYFHINSSIKINMVNFLIQRAFTKLYLGLYFFIVSINLISLFLNFHSLLYLKLLILWNNLAHSKPHEVPLIRLNSYIIIKYWFTYLSIIFKFLWVPNKDKIFCNDLGFVFPNKCILSPKLSTN